MRIYDAAFAASLTAAREDGIAPVYFFWCVGKDRDTGVARPVGLWSGDEDITVTLTQPDGTTVSRVYVGGCNLDIPDGLPMVADLTDNPVTVTLSQIADAAQLLVRGYDVRMAYCEIHATTRAGGVFTAALQLQWVGIVDEGPISTPAVGGDGGISLSVRSEIMWQLTATNPAKSSDSHQKRRNPNDQFAKYSAIAAAWQEQWYKTK
ncbi:hypothetical protein [Paenirhodobacter populi]|uniref:DUF2163 domain-containing protein n=1 Tax=Paenirhodobacter populi TaxID=2306993 RepID=A0A443IQS8_9RHOB|nr:hypothetical protein [Sinirhodobacter populi]RWR08530.1 hypothetical protein D2T33_15655 [Sinirhodobacter populi]